MQGRLVRGGVHAAGGVGVQHGMRVASDVECAAAEERAPGMGVRWEGECPARERALQVARGCGARRV